MCSAGASAKKVSADYNAILEIEKIEEDLIPRFFISAYSFPKLYTIKQENPHVLSSSHWGLIPSFIKDWQKANEIKTQTINAKTETVFEKISFKNSILDKRCIILLDGFFEYQHQGKEKIPYYIFPKKNEPFLIGAIYNNWVNTATGEVFSTTSMLTTEANELMSEIHNAKKRMPLIFDESNAKNWLNNDLTKNEIQDLFQQYPTENMQAHIIDKNLISPKKLDIYNEQIIQSYQSPNNIQPELF